MNNQTHNLVPDRSMTRSEQTTPPRVSLPLCPTTSLLFVTRALQSYLSHQHFGSRKLPLPASQLIPEALQNERQTLLLKTKAAISFHRSRDIFSLVFYFQISSAHSCSSPKLDRNGHCRRPDMTS